MGGSSSKASSPPPKSAPGLSAFEEAQLKLKRQRDRCLKVDRRLGSEVDVCLQKASEAAQAGNREAAIRFLKLKKLKEKRREDLTAQIVNLEVLEGKMEEQRTAAEVLAVMEASNKAIASVQAELPIEKAEALVEAAEDAADYVRQLESVFSKEAMGTHGSMQAELDKEMALLEAEVVGAGGSSTVGMGAGAVGAGAGAASTAAEPFAFDMPLPPEAATPSAHAAQGGGRRRAGSGQAAAADKRRTAVPV
jgi:hypothetical protein